MKKVYSKPEIMFESFVPSVNIAGSCFIKITNSTEGHCAYIPDRDPSSTPVFTDKIGACERDEVDGGYNGICYHNPSDTTDLFNS